MPGRTCSGVLLASAIQRRTRWTRGRALPWACSPQISMRGHSTHSKPIRPGLSSPGRGAEVPDIHRLWALTFTRFSDCGTPIARRCCSRCSSTFRRQERKRTLANPAEKNPALALAQSRPLTARAMTTRHARNTSLRRPAKIAGIGGVLRGTRVPWDKDLPMIRHRCNSTCVPWSRRARRQGLECTIPLRRSLRAAR